MNWPQTPIVLLLISDQTHWARIPAGQCGNTLADVSVGIVSCFSCAG
jgi:hypothetical protein